MACEDKTLGCLLTRCYERPRLLLQGRNQPFSTFKEFIMLRYAKGQRVQVVSAIDGEGKPKYCDVETYVGKFGVIVEYYRIGFKAKSLPSDYYVYEIQLDGDNTIMAIPEGALRPLID
jgi:hypothetical protein